VYLTNTTNAFVRDIRQIILKKTHTSTHAQLQLYMLHYRRDYRKIFVQTSVKVSEHRNGLQRILIVRWNRTRRKKNELVTFYLLRFD